MTKKLKIYSPAKMLLKEKKENKLFDIDRKQEDSDVRLYQQTKDPYLLEKIYQRRIPSISFWAKTYYYYSEGGYEEMFAEFRACFLKAINLFAKKRGSFNTCLYTYWSNMLKNILIAQQAKKRRPKDAEFTFSKSFLTSMDKSYYIDSSDEGVTLKDVISSQMEKHENGSSKMTLKETICILSNNHPVVQSFFRKMSLGNTMEEVIKEYNTLKGSIHDISLQEIDIKNKKEVTSFIKKKRNICKPFVLKSYKVISPSDISFEIQMKKSKETDILIETVNDIRKNKKEYSELFG